ncbi:hypothetical protein E2C01_099623 [Portunus trituberculatus]|uniref:Uncharacterized protein n=1 Tax=Portunus trituberculatus TaxID=210409 RepID=A0A5B7K4A9_PORTR|nr:hypothetical protein [Portunus trituberculatus]
MDSPCKFRLEAPLFFRGVAGAGVADLFLVRLPSAVPSDVKCPYTLSSA